ncbi:MAG: nucleotidyl transferase AbiEii/AbiGii toxin family protein, partial [Thermomicrobiales bacterium]
VVLERLLTLPLILAPDHLLLKVALPLDLRLGARSRTTKDMDLARYDDEEAAATDLLAAQALDLGDYFTFAIERTGRLDAALEGAAVRYHVAAALDGRPFEDVIVDIGFADAIATAPETLRGPDLLRFAAIAPIAVPAVPIAQHVAEKVHAYTRIYASDRRSSRVKDLVDLVLIRSAIAFEAGRLHGALHATFAQRGTHPLPAALPPPPADWGPAYRRLARAVGLDPDLRIGFALAAAFLDPILAGTVSDRARWEPLHGAWEEPN